MTFKYLLHTIKLKNIKKSLIPVCIRYQRLTSLIDRSLNSSHMTKPTNTGIITLLYVNNWLFICDLPCQSFVLRSSFFYTHRWTRQRYYANLNSRKKIICQNCNIRRELWTDVHLILPESLLRSYIIHFMKDTLKASICKDIEKQIFEILLIYSLNKFHS